MCTLPLRMLGRPPFSSFVSAQSPPCLVPQKELSDLCAVPEGQTCIVIIACALATSVLTNAEFPTPAQSPETKGFRRCCLFINLQILRFFSFFLVWF